MNGLDKITARIEADAVAEAAAIIQEAKAQCTRILADAERAAQDRYWERAREGMKSVEDRAQRLNRAADMEARKSVLAFKQEVVSGVFDEVEKRLFSLPEEEYLRFLSDKAVQAAVSGEEELILNAKDKASLGQKLLDAANARLAEMGRKAELRLAAGAGDFRGGLIVRQGNVSVNCTVEALVAQARNDLAADVAATLFS